MDFLFSTFAVMSWKDYFYYQKGDKIAIILLLILIVLCGGFYITLKTKMLSEAQQVTENVNAEAKYIQSEVRDIETDREPSTSIEKPKRDYPKPTYIHQEKLKTGETIELNKADTSELKKIPGIGSAYANRIVKYRNLLGGYANKIQLNEVWGMDDELYNKIVPYIIINTKPAPININTADFKQLNRHPYINFDQTKVILDIRERKGRIESLNRLSLLSEFTDKDIKRLADYLSFD